MALFGSSAESSKLIQFKAGRMNLRDKMVQADKRKGLLYMEYSPERILVLKWSDRTSGQVELDLKLFPGETEFTHVPQCTTGRVYILRFKGTSRKYFFWMQESNDKVDEALVVKMNTLLTSPPPAPASTGLGAGLGGLSGERMQNMLAGMDPQQLSQLLTMSGSGGASQLADLLGRMSGGGMRSGSSSSLSSQSQMSASQQLTSGTGSSTTSSAARQESAASTSANPAPASASSSSAASTAASGSSAASSSRGGVRLEDLRSFFSTNPPAAPSGATQASSLDLSDVIARERLINIISLPDVNRELLPLLPEDGSTPDVETLKSVVSSPQFTSALRVFASGLESGQLAPFMREFGVGDAAIASAVVGDVEGFLRALQDKESADENMDVD